MCSQSWSDLGPRHGDTWRMCSDERCRGWWVEAPMRPFEAWLGCRQCLPGILGYQGQSRSCPPMHGLGITGGMQNETPRGLQGAVGRTPGRQGSHPPVLGGSLQIFNVDEDEKRGAGEELIPEYSDFTSKISALSLNSGGTSPSQGSCFTLVCHLEMAGGGLACSGADWQVQASLRSRPTNFQTRH